MKISNLTNQNWTLTDIDRGLDNRGIYENWIGKQDTGIPASGHLYLFDTEKVMLSVEYGQIKKLKALSVISTEYSLIGITVEPFVIVSGVNDTFSVQIDTGAPQLFTLPAGSLTALQVVNVINASATGFVAEKCDRFFRSSNTDNIVGAQAEGDSGVGYGVRGPAIMSGFIVLVSDDKITIGAGTANDTLGFNEGAFTLAK